MTAPSASFRKASYKNKVPSAAITGVKYDKENGILGVRFSNGNTYRYEDVTERQAERVTQGLATCKTTGRSSYGSWYKGKTPSVGAAFNSLIKNKKPFTRSVSANDIQIARAKRALGF